MRLLGLIGGMSWENTIEYYRLINEMVKEKLGGWNSSKILLYSVNFEEVLPLQEKNKWEQVAGMMIDISKKLEFAGCSALVICSNTMHKIADEIEASISIPLIHVVDETAKTIKAKNIRSVGLLGTRFTMEGGFYLDRLTATHDLRIFLPSEIERKYIHKAIYDEFAQGKFLDSTKAKFLEIIDNLKKKGSDGIILGCTELPILIKQEDVDIPLFDTMKIHLQAAVEHALE
ncbi:MAG: aspartate/glutamate racemase family protein [Promethearchaeota archaeon]|nr:MAG: aspartate/glutamate racemase family protein [Candidatus Lokiarchaeota archaeon]